ncbi:glutamate synthase subunit beta [Aquimarina sp. W85]|uniref:glutamate synthase subunit beta n=1 Tax=Aquimarina rhodophyticola TaxID=3342246 RepID=UPI003671A065
MGKITGFLEYERVTEAYSEVAERIKTYNEFTQPLPQDSLKKQGARCMDCGIPFCHSGCPLGNLIPDFNDAVYRGKWKEASRLLHTTNNFPEFTGRLCPAPCEAACVLGINEDPVAIETIEKNIVERAFSEGWISPQTPLTKSGKRIAIIGSGPSGLAAAQQLNLAGHEVTVYERDAYVGGLLRYGIPDFKLEKHIIERRIDILMDEGVHFKTNCEVGKDITITHLNEQYDAILLCTGANQSRLLSVPGSSNAGVIPAMQFLAQSNKRVSGQAFSEDELVATGKRVIVIGGGDTGSDCIGTAIRQGATSVINFEIMAKAPNTRPKDQPWPYWPMRLRTSSSHEEGVARNWAVATKEILTHNDGTLKGIVTVQVTWKKKDGRLTMIEVPDTQKEWPCDMVLLAMGFLGPDPKLAEAAGLATDQRTNYKASPENYKTNVPKIFAAGDARRGQSLIVWAISEGREAAYHIDTYLMGSSNLPRKGEGDLPRV